jgi:hypothetical protein
LTEYHYISLRIITMIFFCSTLFWIALGSFDCKKTFGQMSILFGLMGV